MAVTRESKEAELRELEGSFKGAESAILVDYRGLKVPEVTELRRQIRGARGRYQVVKNTLATRAIKGTPFEPLTQFFVGTTAVAYSGDDPVALAKVLTTFAKATPALQIKAAVVQGVRKDSPAQQAGIQAGDRIIKIDGIENPTWEQVQPKVWLSPNQALDVWLGETRKQLSIVYHEGAFE